MARIALIGIGNPGEQYARTYHNVGALFTSWLVSRHGGTWNAASKPHHATLHHWHGLQVGETGTYMNKSGQDVAGLARWWKRTDDAIVIVHDDTDQRIGATKLVQGGGAAGHKGVVSVHAHLGENVWRLKIGARPERFASPPHVKAENFVLDRISDAEMEVLEGIAFPEAERLLEGLLG